MLLNHFSQSCTSPDSLFFSSPDLPLVMRPSQVGHSPLMYSEVLQFLKKGAININIDPSRVGIHSVRRTGAMHLYSIGILLNDIRLIGDWKSMAVLVYLSAPFQRLVQVEDLSAAAFNKM